MLDEPRTTPHRLQIGWAVPASGPIRTRWEYLTLETAISGDDETVVAGCGESGAVGEPVAAVLTKLGDADWELISVTPHGADRFLYTFKRPADRR